MADSVNLPPGLAEAIQAYLQQASTVPATVPVASQRDTATVIADAHTAANTLANDALGDAVRALVYAVERLYEDAHADKGMSGV